MTFEKPGHSSDSLRSPGQPRRFRWVEALWQCLTPILGQGRGRRIWLLLALPCLVQCVRQPTSSHPEHATGSEFGGDAQGRPVALADSKASDALGGRTLTSEAVFGDLVERIYRLESEAKGGSDRACLLGGGVG
jgi:hypothetical protein